MSGTGVPAKVLIGLSALLVAGIAMAAPPYTRPNVLVIYADDQGSLDLNCYGSTDLHTPSIDRLAFQGVRFTQFYGAPICSPSRGSLLTGLFTRNAGLTGNASGKTGLPGSRVTIAEMMKANGYSTALIGKWHLGETPGALPNAQGFDYFFGHRGGCIDNYSHYFYWSGPNRHDLWQNDREVWRNGAFFPQLTVEELKSFVQKSGTGQKPWFAYWAVNLPHYPLQGTEKWLDYYKDKGLSEQRRKYAAFISTLDETVGQIVKYLDDTGQRENTIIIYQSDNGHSMEERNGHGGGNAGPYRGAKFSLFEGGIRLPAIISWPGRIPQGAVRDQLCGNVDWFPTLAELCGVDMAPYPVDGKSLLPLIADPAAPTRHRTYHIDVNNQWLVRQGDWKLYFNPLDPVKNVKFGKDDQYYLTNLAQDVSESKNLAEEYPEVVSELLAERKRFTGASTEKQNTP